MPPHGLFSAPFAFLPPDVMAGYQAILPMEFREVWSREELLPDPDLAAWIMNPGQGFVIDDSVLDLYPGLRLLVTPSTGRNHIDVPACTRRAIPVLSLLDDRETLDVITASAEFTFLLLLNTLRRLDRAVAEVAAGRWRAREDPLRGNELAGKQVGLVGFGRIGRRMARYLTAFDAAVAYHDPYVADASYPRWSLEDIFAGSDAVCVCCALTPETTGMIGFGLLASLRPNACLVNTARGEIIVEADLARLLQERPDVRVGLDVLAGEVVGAHHQSPLLPFQREGRVAITPHIAGATLESQTKAAVGALRLLGRHLPTAALVGARGGAA